MEVKVKDLKPILIQYKCDVCDEGYLKPNGQRCANQFLHKCSNENCKVTKLFLKKYPYIDYE